jgi:hypothetical protein
MIRRPANAGNQALPVIPGRDEVANPKIPSHLPV